MQVAQNAGIEGAVVLSKVQAISMEKGVSFIGRGWRYLFIYIMMIKFGLCE
jgi:hypothetical protein